MDIEDDKMSILDYQNSISEDILWIQDLEKDIIECCKMIFNVRDINFFNENPHAKIFQEFEENGKKYFFIEGDYHHIQSMVDSTLQLISFYRHNITKILESIEVSKRKIKELETT